MARESYVSKNIKDPDPGIREAVVGEAQARGITLSDVVGQIIARAWDMEYELSGWKPGFSSGTQLTVRIPQEMAMRIYAVARSTGTTESSVVQELIAHEYDIPFEPIKRGGGTRHKEQVSG